MHTEQLYSIGEFAALTRLSIKALRYYDEQGLLAPTHVDPVTSYRYYAPEQVDRAILIGDLRRVDVPIAVIVQILDSSDDALATYQEWWVGEERRHLGRRGIGHYITARLRRKGQGPMDINTRTVPERKLAVISKELFQPELEPFIMTSFDTLFQWAERDPGLRHLDTTPDEPTYVIFHGPVTPDQAARVEVCIVISGAAEPEGDITLRVEAAHEEAYTTLTREGIQFPAILAAYDSVAGWVMKNGSMIESMPSREVYFTDVLKADVNDPVCDVAFPYTPR